MDHKSTGLAFKESGIADALRQNTLFVPLNQRSYRWPEDKVLMLVEDLTKAFNAGEKIYFLGTIVLTYGDGGRLEVADGQQRLATTSILISVIRDFLLSIDDSKSAEKYQQDYLLEYDPDLEDYDTKLHLNFEDQDYFRESILKPSKERQPYKGPKFISHDRLDDAVRIAKTHLDNMVAVSSQAKQKRSRVLEWVKFLHTNARVILITVPGDIGNAFKMFETLNARGMEASQTDILKNYLFDKGKGKLSEMHTHWISMISTIEQFGEDDLLKKYIRHYWISHNGPTTERDLGSKIEEAIRSERQALDTAAALDSFSLEYAAILAPREDPRWNDFSAETRNCIHYIISDLGVEQILPLLMAITRYFTVGEAQKAFQLCLSYSVRFLIAGRGGGGVLDKHYGNRAMEISNGDIRDVKKLADKMMGIVPTDEEFKVAFSGATVRRASLARYYMRAIDLYQKGEKLPQLLVNEDPDAVNIEHILPINPSKEWGIQKEVAEAYHKKLGNMVLLSAPDNVKIGNKTFDEKKEVYKTSLIISTRWVADYGNWGTEQIVDRQAQLAEIAPRVWPI